MFKNIVILGDSYSAYRKYIPEGYETYYTDDCTKETDIKNVEQMWWHKVIKETNSTLLLNSSYAGTTICNTGYEKRDYRKISFVGRLQEIINKNFFEKNVVDTVFVFGGTNDSWAASPVGDLMYNDWQEKDFYSVLPAICYIFHQLKVVGKKLRIVCIINTELKTNITEGFIKACQYYDVDCIELKSIDKINDHPSALGMEQIKKQILEYFS